MIDRLLAWFDDFVAGCAMAEPADAARLELKRRHCRLVMDEAREQALELNLSPRLVRLATVAGLVHDTGRFPQYQRYRTFRDADSANHAVLGAIALARHHGLAGLPDRDRRLVRLAVVAHNRRTIPRAVLGGDPEALTLVRIVRDADKLDIARIMIEHFKAPSDKDDVVFLGLPDIPDRYNPDVLADIEAGRIGNYAAMGTTNDFALLLLSWINDMAFPRTRRLFFERGHVRELFDVLPGLPALRAFKDRYHDRFGPSAPAA
ncbi:metal-dependent phosphohydrolase HD sub domain protein [Solidesulfovibrio carbinoliphilus subsp. oakridgensis]|uniref:Metal-dependent phosphohydrolase HD sub domain protein n=1 Tax=Solidesulfovibrio carbinoliphilus subsp. oakridgensis TaxID=694327 RepID=G7Q5Q5_9BACT|nr:HD domain-containing protein [Solidesulfovibrio carbinoliphilus]EHJ49614.1 metal-dependent phosphohydrolase HD sub domain protein [Solidesulfovibrio carbinoliphilus subsp. oakridgensis]